jgi:hypothetical protein
VSDKATKYSPDGKAACPEDIVEANSTNPLYKSGIRKRKYLRRFGCLTFFKRNVSPDQKELYKNKPLLPTRVKGINLGFSEKNSAWLVGTINSKGRFAIYQTIDAVFVESVLVRDLQALCAKSTVDPVVDTSVIDPGCRSLWGSTSPIAGAGTAVGKSDLLGPQGTQQHSGLAPEVPQPNLLKWSADGKEEVPDSMTIQEPNAKTLAQEISDIAEAARQSSTSGAIKAPASLNDSSMRPSELEYEFNVPPLRKRKGETKTADTTITESTPGEDDVVYGPPELKRRRGRPAGAKDKNGKRTRRTKQAMKETELQAHLVRAWPGENTDQNPDVYANLTFDETDVHEYEEIEIYMVKAGPSAPGDAVSPAWALSDDNPERPQWIEAKDIEKIRLEAYKTWRPLTPEEEQLWKQGKLKATPCALLFNRKRCGRYKGRLVVLGNRWTPDEEVNSVYASVVSQTGNRAVMVESAKRGFHVIPFDISNAFVRASMGDIRVIVRLPKTFCEGPHDDGKRMLQKALYGLPISPRLWSKTLAKDLTSMGWTECLSEPGVYRKIEDGEVVAYITVYVDDCIVSANSKERAILETEAVNAKHPLQKIKIVEDQDGTIHFDMCGADIAYNATKNKLKIDMANYVEKMLKRFNMKGCKPRSNPGFPEKNLYCKTAKPSEFKFKAAVGALQWLATTARPDIAHATNMLARAGANPVTTSMMRMAHLVFRYLSTFPNLGIEYSRELEADFNKIYSSVANEHEMNKDRKDRGSINEPVQLFTDASFGVAYKTLRSITGVVVYLHGTPIAWKTKVQTIHTSSTTESEWVAIADGIEFSQSIYALENFMSGRQEITLNKGGVWCDNRAAVLCARKGVDGIDEISKKTRHIALRYARVLEHADRLWFVPTDLELADGLTKSSNNKALFSIFHHNHPEYDVDPHEDDEEDLDWSDSYLIWARKLNKN